MTTQWKPDGTICQACWGSGCRYCDARKATPAEPTGAQADADIVRDLRNQCRGCYKDDVPCAICLAADRIESLQYDLESLQRELDIVWRSNAGLTTDVLELRAQLEAARGEIAMLKDKLARVSP